MTSVPCATVAPTLWRRGGRRLALLATAARGSGEKLEREIGDILYELDPRVIVYRPEGLHETVLVYTSVEPLAAFRRLYHWPPAYAQRVVPAFWHLAFDEKSVYRVLRAGLECIRVDAIRLRVDVRGSRETEHMVKTVVARVAGELGIRLTRRASWELIVEGVRGLALIAAVLPVGCDRVEEWWRRNTAPCRPIIS